MEQLTRSNGIVWTRKTNKNRFLYPQEWQAFFAALKPMQQFPVRLLLMTGARIAEAQGIQVQDCFFDHNTIELTHTKAKAKKGEVKGYGRHRLIPISSQFAKELRAYIKEKGLKPDSYLGIQSNSALCQAYKKAGKLAGLREPGDISSHTFRKTLEVWLMALGVDGLKLTAHLGHDMKTAAQYYVSPDVFSYEDKLLIRQIIGDLYQRREAI